MKEQIVNVDGIDVSMLRGGKGPTLVWLHAVDGIHAATSFLESLSRHFDVIAPWLPGFGPSERPADFKHISDLAYFQLTLLEALSLRDVVLVGSSFGGWVAAEMAVRNTSRMSRLVLANAYGVKHGGRESRDIADIYAIPQDAVNALAYRDVSKRKRDYSTMSESELVSIARSRESLVYYAWKPYFHNPGLKRWLRRIDVPTLVAWGEADKIIDLDYGKQYAEAIPGARFKVIPNSGHYVHVEQPDVLSTVIRDFSETTM